MYCFLIGFVLGVVAHNKWITYDLISDTPDFNKNIEEEQIKHEFLASYYNKIRGSRKKVE